MNNILVEKPTEQELSELLSSEGVLKYIHPVSIYTVNLVEITREMLSTTRLVLDDLTLIHDYEQVLTKLPCKNENENEGYYLNRLDYLKIMRNRFISAGIEQPVENFSPEVYCRYDEYFSKSRKEIRSLTKLQLNKIDDILVNNW